MEQPAREAEAELKWEDLRRRGEVACQVTASCVGMRPDAFGDPSLPGGVSVTMDQAPIFIVDDEPMLLELATLILEPLKFSLRTFRDPEQAFKEFFHGQPRPWLLITDYQMHSMNGMDLVRLCRGAEPSVKVLLVSGTVGEEVYARSAIKPDRFLAKPYTPNQLISVVEELKAL